MLKVLGAARGLSDVHRAKVVHRDLKESNVVVRASDGEAVVVDFGAGGYESAPSITGGCFNREPRRTACRRTGASCRSTMDERSHFPPARSL
ncbi:hypothetical protein [Myxococcus eversor]|uniref:hypothetical protein n=1 Tax=Myxococcus eversor TaxID=2709661 RepID=UPI0030846489